MNSSAFFKYVIEGKRNLSKGTLLKTCLAFGLKDKEAEYFENLVFFNQAKTVKEKNLYFDRLTRLRGDYDVKRVEERQYAYYSQWYHSAVRELLAMAKPGGDAKAIAQALLPAISPKQAQDSVDLAPPPGAGPQGRPGEMEAGGPGAEHRKPDCLPGGDQLPAHDAGPGQGSLRSVPSRRSA